MATTAVVIGTLTVFAIFILQIVGFTTPHWYEVSTTTLLGKYTVSQYGGLFQTCNDIICYSYFDSAYDISFVSVHYIFFTGLVGLGTLFLFISLIIGLSSCNNVSPRSPLQNLAGMGFAASFCTLAGVTWFGVIWVNDTDTLGGFASLSSFGIEFGYSFFLVAISGCVCFIFALVSCIVAGNMQPHAVVAPGQFPATGMVVVSSNQQQTTQMPFQNQQFQPFQQQQQQQQQPVYQQPYMSQQPHSSQPVYPPLNTGPQANESPVKY